MAFEIDFLPVGSEARSGDAIAVRYGTPGAYKVLVYDGGTKESGAALVEHIREYYDTNFVDYVINSHPDMDHASGLSIVLEEMHVGELWIHRPWNYSDVILDYFSDGRMTGNSLKTRIQEKLAAAFGLEEIALRKSIPIFEPFQGSTIGAFHVVSPDADWYIHELIADFEKTPEQREIDSIAKELASMSLLGHIQKAASGVVQWIGEQWNIEYLREDVETTAENESSAVLYYHDQEFDYRVLLTGDSGVNALTRSIDYLKYSGVDTAEKIDFFQVPHHGSRNNVSSSVLDKLVGQKIQQDSSNTPKTAFVSAGKGSKTHPRKMVVNAFLRRGASVYATNGLAIRHHKGMPSRLGWEPAVILPFSEMVESWD